MHRASNLPDEMRQDAARQGAASGALWKRFGDYPKLVRKEHLKVFLIRRQLQLTVTPSWLGLHDAPAAVGVADICPLETDRHRRLEGSSER